MRRRSFLLIAALRAWGAERTLGTIAFIRRDGLWIRSLPDGKPERLAGATTLESPRYSPSGNWIAYFHRDALHVISRDGGKSIRLGQTVEPGAQWLPNRDELLVGRAIGLEVFSPVDGWSKASRQIKHASLPAVFSPEGRDILYSNEANSGRGPGGEPMRTGRLCRLPLDKPESKPTVLVSKYSSGQIPCAWTGDGKQILYWEDPDFSASAVADGLELFRIPAEGGSPRSMGVSTLVHNDILSLSPDGTHLAITAGDGRNEWEEKRIAVINLNTSAISYLTDGETAAVCPSWCPRGNRIAFAAAPSPGASVGGGDEARRLLEKRRIWISEASGTRRLRQLTNDVAYRDEGPMWSTDGTQILFCRIDRDNNKTLWLMDAESPSPIQVAGPLYTNPALLRPDETWFGYYGYIDWRTMVDWYRGAGA